MLPMHQRGVVAALPDQLRVRPDLDDAAFLEDEDAVGIDHGRQPMGDDERGAPRIRVSNADCSCSPRRNRCRSPRRG